MPIEPDGTNMSAVFQEAWFAAYEVGQGMEHRFRVAYHAMLAAAQKGGV